MATTQTRNVTVTSTWQQIAFDQISNPYQTTVEFWASTTAPAATVVGHPLKSGDGLTRDTFTDPTLIVWFRSLSMDTILTVTEYI
jgi:hypothetical protein